MSSGEDRRFDWRGGGAAAGALLAALVLLGMVFLVAMSNNARDDALDGERHAYDVTLLTRSLDASISRSEAALGRFVLDEQVKTSGNIYYSQWRLAGQQIYELGKALRFHLDRLKEQNDPLTSSGQRGVVIGAAP